MGSLAAAIRLGAMGFEVFSKNERPGGRMGRLEEGGFTFDTGPSFLLMTDTYRELFSFAGRDLDDYVRLIPLDGQYRVTFGDGDTLTIRRTLPELVKELERIEPGVTPRFYRFLKDACRKYRVGRSEFVERDFEGARELYAAILDRIEAQGYDVYTRRAETSPLGKLRVAASSAARDPKEDPGPRAAGPPAEDCNGPQIVM